MTPEFDNMLCEKYPKIFRDRHGDKMETLMCWGFECGSGWKNILNQACRLIQGHIDWNDKERVRLLENNPYNFKIPDKIPQVVAVQVKEKYGSLRFYVNGGDEYTDGVIAMAEAMSVVTCEVCGDVGKIYTDGWHTCLCEKHAKEQNRTDMEIENV